MVPGVFVEWKMVVGVREVHELCDGAGGQAVHLDGRVDRPKLEDLGDGRRVEVHELRDGAGGQVVHLDGRGGGTKLGDLGDGP